MYIKQNSVIKIIATDYTSVSLSILTHVFSIHINQSQLTIYKSEFLMLVKPYYKCVFVISTKNVTTKYHFFYQKIIIIVYY